MGALLKAYWVELKSTKNAIRALLFYVASIAARWAMLYWGAFKNEAELETFKEFLAAICLLSFLIIPLTIAIRSCEKTVAKKVLVKAQIAGYLIVVGVDMVGWWFGITARTILFSNVALFSLDVMDEYKVDVFAYFRKWFTDLVDGQLKLSTQWKVCGSVMFFCCALVTLFQSLGVLSGSPGFTSAWFLFLGVVCFAIGWVKTVDEWN